MNTPQRVGAWAGAVTATALAVAAVVGPGKQAVTALIAQEAAAVAVKTVTQQMAPQTAELKSIKDLLRDQSILGQYRLCLDTRYQVAEGPARIARCGGEAEYQRAVYGLEDCRRGKTVAEEDPNTCPFPIAPPALE